MKNFFLDNDINSVTLSPVACYSTALTTSEEKEMKPYESPKVETYDEAEFMTDTALASCT